MNYTTKWLAAAFVLGWVFSSQAKDIEFGGYTWIVRSGRGGPGPSAWDERNVWLDANTNLHLKISQRDEKWSCAAITMRTRLGLGRYQWVYRPQDASRYIAQQAMPVHLNLWLFKGLPPKNGQEVEVALRSFRFTPE